eukprot:gene7920-8775_t
MIFKPKDVAILTVLYSLAILTGVLGNAAVLVSILSRSKARSTQSNIFILSLAVCDLVNCALCGPYYITSINDTAILHGTARAYDLCVSFLVFAYTFGIISILSLTLLSLDRYCAVVLPFWYKQRITKRKCAISVAFVWIYSIVIVLPPTFIHGWILFEQGLSCGFRWDTASSSYLMFNVVANLAIPTLVVSVTNAIVFKTARRQNLKTQPVDMKLPDQPTEEKGNKIDQYESSRQASCCIRFRSSLNRFVDKLPSNPCNCKDEGSNMDNESKDLQRYNWAFTEESTSEDQGDIKAWNHAKESESEDRRDAGMQVDTKQCICNTAEIPNYVNYEIPSRKRKKLSQSEGESIFSSNKRFRRLSSELRPLRAVINLGVLKTLRRRSTEQTESIKSLEEVAGIDLHEMPQDDSTVIGKDYGAFTRHSSILSPDSKASPPTGTSRYAACSHKTPTKNMAKTEMKLALATVSLAACFFLSWIPFVAIRLLKATTSLAITETMVEYTSALAFMNAAWNPYVILLTRKEIFRGSVQIAKRLLRRLFCQQPSNTSQID